MFTVGRRRAARLAAAVLASGLVAAGSIVGAGSAVADGSDPAAGGATATLGNLKTYDSATIHENGHDQQVGAGLFEMSVNDGGSIQTYCIDIHNPTQDSAKYQEVSWGASSLGANPGAGKIKWILQNSYPQVNDLTALAKKAGAGSLSPQLAAAGTQVAIWRYSDHMNTASSSVTANNPDAEKLADYLYNSAQSSAEPQASLTLTPPAVSGKSGNRIGPVTVHTDASTAQVSLAPQGAATGVKVVDKNGKSVTTATDGSQLYFNVPAGTADGNAALTVQATTKVPVGRVFTGVGQYKVSQVQILAGSSDSTVTAQATATWAKQGAIPALSAMVDCAKGGVDVTATNKGDEAFTFQLAGKEYTVGAGKAQTITVPVKEGQSYKISISGPKGFSKTFSGILNCKTAGSGGGSSPSPAPSSSSTGGTSTGGSNLAETGSSNATPYIAGAAVALVVIGGGTVFFLRKRKSTPAGQ
ncbi:Cys-Gln thioester bond-forming surface protein [Streptantibioticus ferralitis]|uniref:LAETG motif-containing sortase-dependent surface protein n=1 Tax=Streptantibioticus ferralitis TaxID=236510 RepID=A0ABT5Z5K0_9ACTN|nr:Cys-Gln thioester bond-forming surface protein [Streptantibioticus ferralitis]MDF2258330.1 LAETG motif-containing sortase-dependent surface protein [Streptantibioticus ferralitis]